MQASPHSGQPTVPAPRKPRRPRTPADEHRSINIALYVGGLVLTAAALAFTAAARAPVLTAVSLIIAYLVFAAAGLWLASRVAILKPAGYAIFGTSLALLVVAAVPVNDAFIHNGLLTWALVSVVGLAVYGYASIHLDSHVLGYLVIPFLYSSIFGSTAVLQTPMVWTLVVIMLVSTLVQLGAIILGGRFPDVLARPFGRLHWVVVPGVLLAAGLLQAQLRSLDYVLLFSAAALYYAVNAVQPVAVQFRPVLALACRAAATAALLSLLVHYRVDLPGVFAVLALWLAGVFILLGVIPALSGLPAGQQMPLTGLARGRARRWDLMISLTLALLLALTVHAGLLLPGEPLSTDHYGWLALASAALLAATGYALFGLAARAGSAHAALLGRGLRLTLGAAALIGLPHHPWFTLTWLAIWAAAELRLSGAGARALTHRAQAVAALAVTGWMAGRLTDDPVLGGRLALLGLVLGAAVVVIVLALRGGPGRRRLPETAIYWLLSTAGLAIGTQAYGLAGAQQPVYAVVAMLVIYGTAVLLLIRVPVSRWLTAAQLYAGVRVLSLLSSAVITVLSIEWASAWSGSAGAQAPAGAYALLILFCFAAAEALSAVALSGARQGLGAESMPVLRAPELWPGTHLAAHGLWGGLINLLILQADSLLITDAARLWWLTVPAWAVTCWAGLRAAERSDRQQVSVAARMIPCRVYGLLALTGIVVAVFTGTGLWWADATVAAGAALLAVMTFRGAASLRESPAVATVSAACTAYLAGVSVVALLPGSGYRGTAELLVAAVPAVLAAAAAALIWIQTCSGRLEARGAGDSALDRRQRVLTASGAGASVVFLLSAWHLAGVPGFTASPAESGLQGLLGGTAVICLHLLLHRAAGPPARAFDQTVGMKWSVTPLTAARLAVFAGALVLAGLAVNWPAAIRAGEAAPLEAVSIVSAAAALVLAGVLFAAELVGTARLSQGPAHRWVPAHLAANALWLAAVNMVMLLFGLSGELWWFTAVPWAVASLTFLRGALGTAGERPLPIRDLIAARIYALAVLVLLLGAWGSRTDWWLQALVGLAAVLVAVGVLVWGARLPEASFAVPGYLILGGSAALTTALAELLDGVRLWSAPGDHPAVLGYLVAAGVFLVLVTAMLTARWLWQPGAARRRLSMSTGAGAVLVAFAPLLSAEQHIAAPLAWVVPGMHLVIMIAALRFQRLRGPAALAGPVILPFSVVFAYGMAADPTALTAAIALLGVLTGTLIAEAWLYSRTGGASSRGMQLTHWFTGGTATLLISALALNSDAGAVQFLALGAAALLLVAGLLRGVRLGVYWGAAVVVLSILWALREIMFLFLIALGALILGAAIWRLVVVQKNAQKTPDAAAAPSPTAQHHPSGRATPPAEYRVPGPADSGELQDEQ